MDGWMDGFGRVPRQIESRRGVTGADADADGPQTEKRGWWQIERGASR